MKIFANRTPREIRAIALQIVFLPGALFLAVLAFAGEFNPQWVRSVAYGGVVAGLAIVVVARITDWVTRQFLTAIVVSTMVLTLVIGLSIQPQAIGTLSAFVFLGVAVGSSAFLRVDTALVISVLCTAFGVFVISMRSSIPVVAIIIFLALMTICTMVVIVLRQSLQRARDEAIALSLTDSLTGLANRRSMEVNVPLMSALADRTGQYLGSLLLDLDHFKAVNDTYGHHVGDEILCAVAEALRQGTRESDLCVRIGGDEFSVFTIVSDRDDLQRIAERLRQAIADMPTEPSMTASVGGSVLDRALSPRSPVVGTDLFLRQADRALYQAKSAGRNLIQIDWPSS
ncbi:GGDEF domain-containing protein [Subtercola boreus]|uniref:GGDEF domain-containing protein n=1 Tax=Subtercola boreus TaxID=120213 RepID=UPI0011C06345|nr:sensor domain-containing diguanylate cyclase [Subtercola boreus]